MESSKNRISSDMPAVCWVCAWEETRAISKDANSFLLINGIGFVISKETRMKKKTNKKKRKRLIVQILVVDMENEEYYVDTEQLSDIPIPLTHLERTTPEINNPVPRYRQ